MFGLFILVGGWTRDSSPQQTTPTYLSVTATKVPASSIPLTPYSRSTKSSPSSSQISVEFVPSLASWHPLPPSGSRLPAALQGLCRSSLWTVPLLSLR